jgi:trans-AT polyketide synthase, acyltransferase and oxidoreductase domains
MKAILFPGQGSQRVGMGAGLFARYPEYIKAADEILGFSIEELCLNNPGSNLDRTEFTQPAIYVVSMLQYREYEAKEGKPDFLAGHSLGEYAALTAADALDFTAGLRIVQRRGRLMGEVSGGGLVAVIGAPPEQVTQLLTEHELADVEIANINSPKQVVVGGRKDRLQKLMQACAARGLRAVPLRVSGAFHTSYMATAATKLADALMDVEFAPQKIPVISNVTGEPHDSASIRRNLADHLTKPVQWSRSIETMIAAGAEDFIELGEHPVLTPLVSDIRRSVRERAMPREAENPATPDKIGLRVPAEQDFRTTFKSAGTVIAGSLGNGISGTKLVRSLAKAGVLAFLDTQGLDLPAIRDAIAELSSDPDIRGRFGVALHADLDRPENDQQIVDVLLGAEVPCLEAFGYPAPSAALLRYRGGSGRNSANPRGRVIARVHSIAAVHAFLSSGLSGAEIAAGSLETGAGPGVDAICVELNSPYATDGSPWGLLSALLEWRDNYRARPACQPFFVGMTGGLCDLDCAAAFECTGVDFINAGPLFIFSDEAVLDDDTKQALREGRGTFEDAPDWLLPEFTTRSFSFTYDPKLLKAARQLRDLYVFGHATESTIQRLAAEMPEPYSSRLRSVTTRLAACTAAVDFRRVLRQSARASLHPGIVSCDASTARLRRALARVRGGAPAGFSAQRLTEMLNSRNSVKRAAMES